MALTGAQKAYRYARSGVARSGATRSAWVLWTVGIMIETDTGPQDVTAHVAAGGWSLNLNINDDVDTATLRLLPTVSFVPSIRAQMTIRLGHAHFGEPLLFAGLVMTVQRTREPGPAGRWWYDLTCVDWLTIFDAHFVTTAYPQQSATTTILDLVARYTRGQFSTVGVAPGMPTVDGMDVINERPSTVLRRLTNAVGGGFYIDAHRRVRAWSAQVAVPLFDQDPQPLTDTNPTLKTFTMTEDGTQQRTRVIVEGARTSTLLGLPYNAGGGQTEIPIADASNVHLVDAPNPPYASTKYMRIGTQIYEAVTVRNATPDQSKNAPSTTTTEALPLDSIYLHVADSSQFVAPGWCDVAGQIVRFHASFNNILSLTNRPDYGCLQAPVGINAVVTLVSSMIGRVMSHPVFTNPSEYYRWVQAAGPIMAQDTGAPVVLVGMLQDPNVANQLQFQEDSDGYYEHLVQDGRFGSAGALTRAQAELQNFATPTVIYEWDTEDVNAEPGRLQVINLPTVSTTVRITNVTITPTAPNYPPRRRVRAARVQPASVLDVWVDDTR